MSKMNAGVCNLSEINERTLDLSTDVLAIKCIDKYIFIGIGCFLYAVDRINNKILTRISALPSDSIHGIVTSNDRLYVYGGKSLCIYYYEINHDTLSLQSLGDVQKFDDWIICMDFLGSNNDVILTILFAHNNVYNYNIVTRRHINISCKEACLLYSGALSGQNYERATVFSGTALQEILIWKLNKQSTDTFSEVLHRLKGHKGVIFSVMYDPLNNIICSTSDDRTVRLWKISNEQFRNREIINWEDVKISLETTMYAHLARVWKVDIFKNMLISIGEDSRICFWTLSGELLHKIEAHQGAPIWCIDMSEDGIIYTGAADGSVNSWSLKRINNQIKNDILLENKEDETPKYVTFMSNNDLLIHTNLKNTSKLLHYGQNNYKLVNSYDLPDYSSSYCVIELSLDQQYLALGSIQGDVTLYKNVENSWKHSGSYKITDTKIFSMQWLNADTILVCADEGILHITKFLTNGMEIISKQTLPSSRERWVTSACLYNDVLVCGDRMGSIFVYKLKIGNADPVQTFKKIHGRLGVQSCTIINNNLLTTGRDGTLKFYEFRDINSNVQVLEYLYTKNMPMDWVCKLLRTESSLYVLGFKEDDFLVYNVLSNRVLVKIPCGGGHRSWDCKITDKFINFAYVQKKQVHVVSVPIDTLTIPPIMTGFHTKEIYCMAALPMLSNHSSVMISGGEDCTLNLSYLNFSTSEAEMKLKKLNALDGHLSSIKCISVLDLGFVSNLRKYLVFSGGGRAQLKIWEIAVKNTERFLAEEDVTYKDLLSYMLHGPDDERDKVWVGQELMYNVDPETRFMDVSTMRVPHDPHNIFVFVACSDGYLRTLNYNVTTNELILVNTLAYNNRCILKVHSFFEQGRVILITLATDGLLNFWNVFIYNGKIEISKVYINGKESFKLHQSGINSYDIKALNDSEYMLATGGDDNLLSLLTFKIVIKNNFPSVSMISSCKTTNVHCAQITGIILLNDGRLVSVGADQKLAVHKYTYHDSMIFIRLLEDNSSCIPDVQGITFCGNKSTDTNIFCIIGKGFQLLEY